MEHFHSKNNGNTISIIYLSFSKCKTIDVKEKGKQLECDQSNLPNELRKSVIRLILVVITSMYSRLAQS